ncbi:MAG: DUF2130 domain-containing protein, partial [Planctomycetota bacterium]
MHDIICPQCHKAFKVDEAGYAEIAKQVRDREFQQQIHERLELAEQEKRNALDLERAKLTGEAQRSAAEKDALIKELRLKLDSSGVERDLSVKVALANVEKERDKLAGELARVQQESATEVKLAEASLRNELQKSAASKDAEIQALKSRLEGLDVKQQLALKEAVGSVEKQRDELKHELERTAIEKQLAEVALKDKYETQLRDRDEAIERLRDLKARLSTKMVGETLEQHCETEFNRIRATAFPRAYFEKDNDARSGSKGDFVFRDRDEAGTEIVSIMF